MGVAEAAIPPAASAAKGSALVAADGSREGSARAAGGGDDVIIINMTSSSLRSLHPSARAAGGGDEDSGCCFQLSGFPSVACNGLYREDGAAGDYVNAGGYHCFLGRKIGDWVVKDAFEPECQSASAIAGWGIVDNPVVGTSSWRWWASGWEDVLVTVSSGNVSAEPPQEAPAQPEAAQQSATAPVDFSLLSAEIVMLVMHHSRLKRSRGAMACVCRGWRDAARERARRPSIMVGAVMNESSFKAWTAKRMEASPHSFG